MEYKGRVWENGSGSIGLDSSEQRQAKKEKLESELYSSGFALLNKKEDYYIPADDGISTFVGTWSMDEAYDRGLVTKDDRVRFGLSNATILRVPGSKRDRKGLKGISTYGKNMIQNASLRLQKEIGRPCMGFLTITVPTLPDKVIESVTATDWGFLEKSLYAYISRKLKAQGLGDVGFVGVVEIQGARFKETGHAYPHWHFIVPIKKSRHSAGGTKYNPWVFDLKTTWQDFEDIVWRWFHRVLAQYKLGSKCIAEFRKTAKFRCTIDLKHIKKDAAKYISKYMSKGSLVSKMKERGMVTSIPYQWWYVSKSLKERVMEHILNVSGKVGSHIYYDMQELVHCHLVDWFVYLYLSRKEDREDEEPQVIGISFHATSDGVAHLRELIELEWIDWMERFYCNLVLWSSLRDSRAFQELTRRVYPCGV